MSRDFAVGYVTGAVVCSAAVWAYLTFINWLKRRGAR